MATIPAFNVSVGDVFVAGTSAKNETVAVEDLFDLGTYPIFLASDITFSLSTALSMKTSFTTALVLYAVMYELYARESINILRFDPSKSKSVKFEFALK